MRDIRYQLESIAEVLAKTNQAVATLETYRNRLDQVSSRLTALEFQNAATLDDVLVVLQRAEMATRMGEEIERNVIELGREGRLIDMQLTELMEGVPRDRTNLVRDYLAEQQTAPTARWRRLADLPYRRLLDFSELAEVLGHGAVNPLDQPVTPRGYRALAHVPRLTDDDRPHRRRGVRRARPARARAAARARVAGRRRPRAGPRDPRGPAPPAGAQPHGSLPAAVIVTVWPAILR